MLIGKKALYIYKPNDENHYLRFNNGSFERGTSTDTNENKKQYGSFFISSEIPQYRSECTGSNGNPNTKYTTCLYE